MNIRRLFPHLFLPLLLVLWAAQANAQTIYKCMLDGKTSYGEAPCVAGAAQQVLIPTSAPAPATERGERLRQRAEQLTKQRHQREAREQQAQQRADKAAASRRDRCARLKLQRQWANEDAVHAMREREAGKAALKARRAGEKLASACPQ